MKYAYIFGLVLALGNVVSAMPTDGSEIDKALEQTNTNDPQVPEVKLDENKDKPKDANTSSNVVIHKTKRKIDESHKPEESKDKPEKEEKPSAPDAKAPEAPATSSPAAIYPTPPEKSPAPNATVPKKPVESSPAVYPVAPNATVPEKPVESSPAAVYPVAPEKPKEPSPVAPNITLPEKPAQSSPAVYPVAPNTTVPEKPVESSPAVYPVAPNATVPEKPVESSPAAVYPVAPEKPKEPSPVAPNITLPEKPAQSSPAVYPVAPNTTVPEKPVESSPAAVYPVAPEKPKEPSPVAPNITLPEKPAQSSPAVYPVAPEKPKESAPAEVYPVAEKPVQSSPAVYPVAPETPKESTPVHPPQAPQADKPLNGTEFTPVYQLPNNTAPQVPEVPVYPLSDSGNYTNAADYAASQIKSIGGSEEQVKLAVECAEKAMEKVNVTSKASAATIGKAVTEAIQQQKTPEQIQKIAHVAAMNAAVTETQITISVTTVKTKVTNIIQQLGGNEQECQAAADAAQYAATKVYETCVPCAKDKGTAKSIYKAITNVYKNKGSPEEMKTAAVAAATSYSSVYSKVHKQTSTSAETNTVNSYDSEYTGSETQTSTDHYAQPSAQSDAPTEEQYQPATVPSTETVTEQAVAADDYPKSEVMTLMKQAGCTEEDCKLGVQIVETVQKEYNAHSAECVSKISYAVAYSYGSGGSQDDLWSSARTAASTCTSTSTVTDQAATQTGTETATYHQSPQLNTDTSTATQTETHTDKVLPVLPPAAQANEDVEQRQPLRQRLPVLPPSSGEVSNSVYGSPAINFKPADTPKMSQYSKGYSPDGTCGPQSAGNWMCRPGSCCSVYGHCGNTIEFCGRGCQASFGNCLIEGASESTCLCTDSQTKLQRVETFLGGTATQTSTETHMDKNFTSTNTQTGTYNVNGYQHPKYPANVEDEDDEEEEVEEPTKNATQNYLDALGQVLEGKQK
ncbi:hypothetical protein MP638_005915 [Amoeboaphelidium occidentale]|nr:hypothetical protein MP638_005915 [Amoeboaphelidium occidentale]